MLTSSTLCRHLHLYQSGVPTQHNCIIRIFQLLLKSHKISDKSILQPTCECPATYFSSIHYLRRFEVNSLSRKHFYGFGKGYLPQTALNQNHNK